MSQSGLQSRAPTVFLSFTGLLEPLGRSQILAYLEGISEHFAVTVVSLEKTSDLADERELYLLGERCKKSGITWEYRKFRHSPPVLATAVNMLVLLSATVKIVKFRRPSVLHARSLLPAIVGMAIAKTGRLPLVFDMRGLWPEEQISTGRIRRRSLLHRILVAAEDFCLRESESVVSLTEAALHHRDSPLVRNRTARKTVVIPTCVDLDKFTMREEKTIGPLVHGCVGSVLSGWYRVDWLRTWIETVSAEDENALFEIVTRDNLKTVLTKLNLPEHLLHKVSIFSRKSDEMPETIRHHDLSLLFYSSGELSKIARSPTRMAEVLATGIPVVASSGVGDVDSIILDHQVGVVLEGGNPNQMRAAHKRLNLLLRDPLLSQRCRDTARDLFSLESGVGKYVDIYNDLVMGRKAPITGVSDRPKL